MPRNTLRATLLLAPFALSLLSLGCDEGDPNAKRKVKLRETIRKTTQDVRRLEPEVAAGGEATDGKIKAKDYITLQGESYVSAVGNIAKMKIDMDIRQFEALEDRKPKDYDEFMDVIIKKGKADGIQLPMLPFYQEYAYDEKKCELVVLEYPQRKKDFQEQEDKTYGRR